MHQIHLTTKRKTNKQNRSRWLKIEPCSIRLGTKVSRSELPWQEGDGAVVALKKTETWGGA